MLLKLLAIFSLSLPCFAMNLSLEEKVGQLLMVHFNGEIANDDARVLIQDIGVGGIIYYNWSNGLHSPKQVEDLSCSLQKLAQENKTKIPLLIAVDQEGGRVTRLREGFTEFPANQALGDTKKPELAKKVAYVMGRELKAVGINMNLAPVVDINNNPKNPVIGTRSFGSDRELVTLFGKQALMGYKEANIIATLKHFPGHGDVETDSHENLPVINKPLKCLQEMELIPFQKLGASADVIMTAHLLVKAFDQDHCSTLSKKTLDYLRNEIGFQGVIMTDSLVMKGVLKECDTIDEAAIYALNAGCDILLFGGRQLIDGHVNLELSVNDIKRIQQSIIHAVKTGRVPLTRLDDAVQKILKLKEKYL